MLKKKEMKKYKISFTGREINAIGKFYSYSKTVQADDLDSAVLRLYDTHDHIFVKTVNGKPYDYNLTFNQFENL